MQTSTASKKKADHAESYYQIMVKAGEGSPHLKDIEQVEVPRPWTGCMHLRACRCILHGMGDSMPHAMPCTHVLHSNATHS